MLRVILQRLSTLLPVLLVVLLAVFLLSALLPGDPAEIIAGEVATPEMVEQVRADLGFDKPIPVQFVDYLGDLVQGDMGDSVYTRKPVRELIRNAIPPTASLALVAMVVAIVGGGTTGILAALRRGRLLDRAVSSAAAVALAIPPFVFGLLIVIPFAIDRSWLPATGYRPLSEGLVTWIKPLILPGVALGMNLAAEITRQVRGALVDTLEQDYIRTARASGLSSQSIVLKHGMRNAAIPVVTVIGLQAGRLIGATVVVEGVFAIPGFGALAYTAVLGRDLPLIQGVTLVSALIVIVVNMLVDISYVYLNPKLR